VALPLFNGSLIRRHKCIPAFDKLRELFWDLVSSHGRRKIAESPGGKFKATKFFDPDNLGRGACARISLNAVSSTSRRRSFGERCSETTAMHSQSRYGAGRTGRPRSRGRVAGDKGEHRHQSQFDNPAECRVREPGATAAVLGTKAKPLAAYRRRLCCRFMLGCA